MISLLSDGSCFNFLTDDLSYFYNCPPPSHTEALLLCDKRQLHISSPEFLSSLVVVGRMWRESLRCVISFALSRKRQEHST